MAKLKCKNCEKLFELNGTEDINCPYCGVKLKNSYTEWIKKPGHENRTFDDYKKKKCYPSHHHTHCHFEENDHSHSDPYKNIYKAKKAKRLFKKRFYIYGSIILFLMVALFTNPNTDAHKKAFHEKLFGKKEIQVSSSTIIRRDELEDSSWKYKSVIDDVEDDVSVDDFLIFSITKLTWMRKTYPVGFGFWGYVYISDVKKYKERLCR